MNIFHELCHIGERTDAIAKVLQHERQLTKRTGCIWLAQNSPTN